MTAALLILRANAFRLAVLASYMIVLAYALCHHAMWCDEMQAWLIARDSNDVPDLFYNLGYEGHPALWHLLLMPVAHSWRNPAAMQLLHFAIASSTIAIVLWLAPFFWYEKALFPFGYFTLYEYAVKSRSYALGGLLLSVFCSLWSCRRRHPIPMAVILALMANVHALFLILSVAAFGAVAFERVFGSTDWLSLRAASPLSDLFSVLVVITGWAIAVASAWPPSDTGFLEEWGLFFSLERVTRLLHSMGILFGPRASWLATTVVIGFAATGALFSRTPGGFFLSISSIGLLAFYYLKLPYPAVWHLGPVFFAWIAAIWLDRVSERAMQTRGRTRVFDLVFAATLVSQTWYGIDAVRADLQRPLSSGFKVAQYIQSQGWHDDPLAGISDYSMAAIIGYLRVDRAYFLQGSRWGSFTVWDRARRANIDWDELLATVRRLGSRVTLVLSADKQVDPALLTKHGFLRVARFDDAAISDENYVLYRSGE
jgi:hypothetical protein